MKRRDFLKLAGIGTVGAGLGSAAYRATGWWNQPSARGREILSADEVAITEAIVDAMFPGESMQPNGMPNGTDAGIVEHLDGYLAAIDAHSSRLMRLLLHLIDEGALVSDLTFRRFRYRSRKDRIAILKAWDNSEIVFRRKAFGGLKLILAGGYCTHETVLQVSGIHYTCGGAG
ncbi:MAG: twin-arginine translocation signal domain-containing protein [Bradymonadaceae bacterium]